MKRHIKNLKKKLKNYDPKLKEECGVFGISNAKEASALTALGLHALQHRGQEGCGIVSFDGKKYYSEKRFGLVGDNFNKEKVLNNLKVVMLLDIIVIAQLEIILLEIFSLSLPIQMLVVLASHIMEI